MTQDDMKKKDENQKEVEDDMQMEEPESRDKIIRANLEKFLYQSIAGELVRKFIGLVSIGSAVAFIYFTETDWSIDDPCCMVRDAEDVCPKGCDPVNDCLVFCDEFYHSRMPKVFELADLLICFMYLANYILVLFISPNRCIYFISNESLMDMFIMVPVFIYRYDCGKLGLFLKSLSRMLRIYKVDIFLRTKDSGEESNVAQKKR